MMIRINELQALAISALLVLATACSDDEPLGPYGGTGGTSTGGSPSGGGGSTAGGSGGTGGSTTGGSGGTSGDSGVAGASTGGAAGSSAGGAAGSSTGGAAGSASGGTGGTADGGLPANVAYPGAPPTMLHQPYGCNTNCLSCHGASTGSGGAPTTPHPERRMCRQCHLPQANVPLFVGNTFGQ